MVLVAMRQPVFGRRRVHLMHLVDGRRMVRDVMPCLGVGMHGGGKKRGRGDQQNMPHFTLQSLLESGRCGDKSRSNPAE